MIKLDVFFTRYIFAIDIDQLYTKYYDVIMEDKWLTYGRFNTQNDETLKLY